MQEKNFAWSALLCGNKKTGELFSPPVENLFRFRLSLGQNRAGLVLQRVLRDVDDFKERGVVGRGEIRNDLAVEFNFGGNQAFDEAAVSDASGAGGGVFRMFSSTHLPRRTGEVRVG